MERMSNQLKYIKVTKANDELRQIYWHIGITDFFKTDSKLTPVREYADNIITLAEILIKKRGTNETTMFESLADY